MPYFDKPVGRVKIQTTSKNSQRYYTTKRLIRVGGDRGAGVRENRGREGYGRRERKGRESGVLRGRAAGEKYETLIFLIQQCVRILSKTRTQNIRANYNAGLD